MLKKSRRGHKICFHIFSEKLEKFFELSSIPTLISGILQFILGQIKKYVVQVTA